MAGGPRIRGQEVSVIITRDSVVETELTDIQSFSFTYQFEKKKDGFLGETAPRVDMVFMGVKGSIKMHLHTQDYFLFVEAVKAIAQRKTPDSFINVTGVLSFGNGETPSMVMEKDVFGDIPIDVSARGDFVTATHEFECSDCVAQFS